MIDVHLCCNDERGNFTGKVCAVAFYDEAGDLLASLESSELNECGVDLDDLVGRRRHVGNLLWDAMERTEAQAIDYARWLVGKGFVVTEYVDESPWDSLEGPRR